MKCTAASEASAQVSHLAKVCLVLGAALAGVTTDIARAGGTNPNVVHGNVTFETRGNKTIIRAGDGSIINYLNFNIAQGEVVRFIQPSQLSRVLNRITGGEASIMAGTLRANGQVYFVNPAGVYFQNGAVVNVNGLHVAAGSLSNANFLAGADRFKNLTGSVVNNGSITADRVDLVGKHVANHGDIDATRGILTMVAGNDVVIMENGGKISVKIDGTKVTDQAMPQAGTTTPDMNADPGVENTGTLKAGHGQVVLGAGDMYSLAVRNSGTINASGGGSITVAATDGLVHNTATGVISADVAKGQAGEVVVQGPSIVNSGAITADSDSGRAGYVEVTSQNHTYLTDGSIVSASGGDGVARGGEVLIHSYDGATIASSDAQVSVHGGAMGGDGGFAEVSGKNLTFNATAQLDAVGAYDPGTLLLDPKNIFITDSGGDDSQVADGMINFGDDPTMDFAISDESLESLNGNILLQALLDIYFMQRVDFQAGTNLTLEAGRTISFNERLTGLNNLDVLASQTDPTGHIFVNTPLEVAGTATFTGTRTFLNGFELTSGAEQEYFGAVDLCQDTTLTATFVNFHDTVDSTTVGDHGLTVRGHSFNDGVVTFDGAVGNDRRLEFLSVLGDSTVNGGLVETKLFQTYLGDTVLGADTDMISTELGQIRFGGPVDGAFSLHVFTGGLTRFDGVVGGNDKLTHLSTDGPGVTQIGADLNATEGIVIGDAARLVADVEATAGDFVVFMSTIDGDFDGVEHDLIINSDTTLFASDVTGIDLLRTDAPGLTEVGVFVPDQTGGHFVDVNVEITGNKLDFGDDVGGVVSAVFTGHDFVKFHQKLDSFAEVDVFSNKFIYFGGDVGSEAVLESLDATILDQSLIDQNLIVFDGNLVRVGGDINLNANGRNAPARVASIAARNFGGITFESQKGSINFGPNEKFTSLGNLQFIAPNGSVTVGDLNAFGNIFVDTPVINIRKRAPGQILNHQGNYVSDNGTTIVVFGSVSGSAGSDINLIGSGADPVFASRVLSNLGGPAADFVGKLFAALAQANFTFGGTILDLAPPLGSDLGTAFAFPPTRVRDRIYLDPFAERNSEDLGLTMRGPTLDELRDTVDGNELYNDAISEAGKTWSDQPMVTTRLRRDAVLDALTANDAVFYRTEVDPETGEPILDENGAPVRTSIRPQLKQMFADAWKGYEAAEAAAPADAKPTFMGWLASDPDQADTYGYAVGVRDLLVSLEATGMTAHELDASYAKVLTPIAPTPDWHTFKDALMAPEAVQAQPVQARNEDAPVNAG